MISEGDLKTLINLTNSSIVAMTNKLEELSLTIEKGNLTQDIVLNDLLGSLNKTPNPIQSLIHSFRNFYLKVSKVKDKKQNPISTLLIDIFSRLQILEKTIQAKKVLHNQEEVIDILTTFAAIAQDSESFLGKLSNQLKKITLGNAVKIRKMQDEKIVEELKLGQNGNTFQNLQDQIGLFVTKITPKPKDEQNVSKKNTDLKQAIKKQIAEKRFSKINKAINTAKTTAQDPKIQKEVKNGEAINKEFLNKESFQATALPGQEEEMDPDEAEKMLGEILAEHELEEFQKQVDQETEDNITKIFKEYKSLKEKETKPTPENISKFSTDLSILRINLSEKKRAELLKNPIFQEIAQLNAENNIQKLIADYKRDQDSLTPQKAHTIKKEIIKNWKNLNKDQQTKLEEANSIIKEISKFLTLHRQQNINSKNKDNGMVSQTSTETEKKHENEYKSPGAESEVSGAITFILNIVNSVAQDLQTLIGNPEVTEENFKKVYIQGDPSIKNSFNRFVQLYRHVLTLYSYFETTYPGEKEKINEITKDFLTTVKGVSNFSQGENGENGENISLDKLPVLANNFVELTKEFFNEVLPQLKSIPNKEDAVIQVINEILTPEDESTIPTDSILKISKVLNQLSNNTKEALKKIGYIKSLKTSESSGEFDLMLNPDKPPQEPRESRSKTSPAPVSPSPINQIPGNRLTTYGPIPKIINGSPKPTLKVEKNNNGKEEKRTSTRASRSATKKIISQTEKDFIKAMFQSLAEAMSSQWKNDGTAMRYLSDEDFIFPKIESLYLTALQCVYKVEESLCKEICIELDKEFNNESRFYQYIHIRLTNRFVNTTKTVIEKFEEQNPKIKVNDSYKNQFSSKEQEKISYINIDPACARISDHVKEINEIAYRQQGENCRRDADKKEKSNDVKSNDVNAIRNQNYIRLLTLFDKLLYDACENFDVATLKARFEKLANDGFLKGFISENSKLNEYRTATLGPLQKIGNTPGNDRERFHQAILNFAMLLKVSESRNINETRKRHQIQNEWHFEKEKETGKVVGYELRQSIKSNLALFKIQSEANKSEGKKLGRSRRSLDPILKCVEILKHTPSDPDDEITHILLTAATILYLQSNSPQKEAAIQFHELGKFIPSFELDLTDFFQKIGDKIDKPNTINTERHLLKSNSKDDVEAQKTNEQIITEACEIISNSPQYQTYKTPKQETPKQETSKKENRFSFGSFLKTLLSQRKEKEQLKNKVKNDINDLAKQFVTDSNVSNNLPFLENSNNNINDLEKKLTELKSKENYYLVSIENIENEIKGKNITLQKDQRDKLNDIKNKVPLVFKGEREAIDKEIAKLKSPKPSLASSNTTSSARQNPTNGINETNNADKQSPNHVGEMRKKLDEVPQKSQKPKKKNLFNKGLNKIFAIFPSISKIKNTSLDITNESANLLSEFSPNISLEEDNVNDSIKELTNRIKYIANGLKSCQSNDDITKQNFTNIYLLDESGSQVKKEDFEEILEDILKSLPDEANIITLSFQNYFDNTKNLNSVDNCIRLAGIFVNAVKSIETALEYAKDLSIQKEVLSSFNSAIEHLQAEKNRIANLTKAAKTEAVSSTEPTTAAIQRSIAVKQKLYKSLFSMTATILNSSNDLEKLKKDTQDTQAACNQFLEKYNLLTELGTKVKEGFDLLSPIFAVKEALLAGANGSNDTEALAEKITAGTNSILEIIKLFKPYLSNEAELRKEFFVGIKKYKDDVTKIIKTNDKLSAAAKDIYDKLTEILIMLQNKRERKTLRQTLSQRQLNQTKQSQSNGSHSPSKEEEKQSEQNHASDQNGNAPLRNGHDPDNNNHNGDGDKDKSNKDSSEFELEIKRKAAEDKLPDVIKLIQEITADLENVINRHKILSEKFQNIYQKKPIFEAIFTLLPDPNLLKTFCDKNLKTTITADNYPTFLNEFSNSIEDVAQKLPNDINEETKKAFSTCSSKLSATTKILIEKILNPKPLLEEEAITTLVNEYKDKGPEEIIECIHILTEADTKPVAWKDTMFFIALGYLELKHPNAMVVCQGQLSHEKQMILTLREDGPISLGDDTTFIPDLINVFPFTIHSKDESQTGHYVVMLVKQIKDPKSNTKSYYGYYFDPKGSQSVPKFIDEAFKARFTDGLFFIPESNRIQFQEKGNVEDCGAVSAFFVKRVMESAKEFIKNITEKKNDLFSKMSKEKDFSKDARIFFNTRIILPVLNKIFELQYGEKYNEEVIGKQILPLLNQITLKEMEKSNKVAVLNNALRDLEKLKDTGLDILSKKYDLEKSKIKDIILTPFLKATSAINRRIAWLKKREEIVKLINAMQQIKTESETLDDIKSLEENLSKLNKTNDEAVQLCESFPDDDKLIFQTEITQVYSDVSNALQNRIIDLTRHQIALDQAYQKILKFIAAMKQTQKEAETLGDVKSVTARLISLENDQKTALEICKTFPKLGKLELLIDEAYRQAFTALENRIRDLKWQDQRHQAILTLIKAMSDLQAKSAGMTDPEELNDNLKSLDAYYSFALGQYKDLDTNDGTSSKYSSLKTDIEKTYAEARSFIQEQIEFISKLDESERNRFTVENYIQQIYDIEEIAKSYKVIASITDITEMDAKTKKVNDLKASALKIVAFAGTSSKTLKQEIEKAHASALNALTKSKKRLIKSALLKIGLVKNTAVTLLRARDLTNYPPEILSGYKTDFEEMIRDATDLKNLIPEPDRGDLDETIDTLRKAIKHIDDALAALLVRKPKLEELKTDKDKDADKDKGKEPAIVDEPKAESKPTIADLKPTVAVKTTDDDKVRAITTAKIELDRLRDLANAKAGMGQNSKRWDLSTGVILGIGAATAILTFSIGTLIGVASAGTLALPSYYLAAMATWGVITGTGAMLTALGYKGIRGLVSKTTPSQNLNQEIKELPKNIQTQYDLNVVYKILYRLNLSNLKNLPSEDIDEQKKIGLAMLRLVVTEQNRVSDSANVISDCIRHQLIGLQQYINEDGGLINASDIQQYPKCVPVIGNYEGSIEIYNTAIDAALNKTYKDTPLLAALWDKLIEYHQLTNPENKPANYHLIKASWEKISKYGDNLLSETFLKTQPATQLKILCLFSGNYNPEEDQAIRQEAFSFLANSAEKKDRQRLMDFLLQQYQNDQLKNRVENVFIGEVIDIYPTNRLLDLADLLNENYSNVHSKKYKNDKEKNAAYANTNQIHYQFLVQLFRKAVRDKKIVPNNKFTDPKNKFNPHEKALIAFLRKLRPENIQLISQDIAKFVTDIPSADVPVDELTKDKIKEIINAGLALDQQYNQDLWEKLIQNYKDAADTASTKNQPAPESAAAKPDLTTEILLPNPDIAADKAKNENLPDPNFTVAKTALTDYVFSLFDNARTAADPKQKHAFLDLATQFLKYILDQSIHADKDHMLYDHVQPNMVNDILTALYKDANDNKYDDLPPIKDFFTNAKNYIYIAKLLETLSRRNTQAEKAAAEEEAKKKESSSEKKEEAQKKEPGSVPKVFFLAGNPCTTLIESMLAMGGNLTEKKNPDGTFVRMLETSTSEILLPAMKKLNNAGLDVFSNMLEQERKTTGNDIGVLDLTTIFSQAISSAPKKKLESANKAMLNAYLAKFQEFQEATKGNRTIVDVYKKIRESNYKTILAFLEPPLDQEHKAEKAQLALKHFVDVYKESSEGILTVFAEHLTFTIKRPQDKTPQTVKIIESFNPSRSDVRKALKDIVGEFPTDSSNGQALIALKNNFKKLYGLLGNVEHSKNIFVRVMDSIEKEKTQNLKIRETAISAYLDYLRDAGVSFAEHTRIEEVNKKENKEQNKDKAQDINRNVLKQIANWLIDVSKERGTDPDEITKKVAPIFRQIFALDGSTNISIESLLDQMERQSFGSAGFLLNNLHSGDNQKTLQDVNVLLENSRDYTSSEFATRAGYKKQIVDEFYKHRLTGQSLSDNIVRYLITFPNTNPRNPAAHFALFTEIERDNPGFINKVLDFIITNDPNNADRGRIEEFISFNYRQQLFRSLLIDQEKSRYARYMLSNIPDGPNNMESRISALFEHVRSLAIFFNKEPSREVQNFALKLAKELYKKATKPKTPNARKSYYVKLLRAVFEQYGKEFKNEPEKIIPNTWHLYRRIFASNVIGTAPGFNSDMKALNEAYANIDAKVVVSDAVTLKNPDYKAIAEILLNINKSGNEAAPRNKSVFFRAWLKGAFAAIVSLKVEQVKQNKKLAQGVKNYLHALLKYSGPDKQDAMDAFKIIFETYKDYIQHHKLKEEIEEVNNSITELIASLKKEFPNKDYYLDSFNPPNVEHAGRNLKQLLATDQHKRKIAFWSTASTIDPETRTESIVNYSLYLKHQNKLQEFLQQNPLDEKQKEVLTKAWGRDPVMKFELTLSSKGLFLSTATSSRVEEEKNPSEDDTGPLLKLPTS